MSLKKPFNDIFCITIFFFLPSRLTESLTRNQKEQPQELLHSPINTNAGLDNLNHPSVYRTIGLLPVSLPRDSSLRRVPLSLQNSYSSDSLRCLFSWPETSTSNPSSPARSPRLLATARPREYHSASLEFEMSPVIRLRPLELLLTRGYNYYVPRRGCSASRPPGTMLHRLGLQGCLSQHLSAASLRPLMSLGERCWYG